MSEITLEVSRRETIGKNKNRQLRSEGYIPAVVYGGGRDPVKIQVGQRKMEELLRNAESDNPVFLLKLADSDKSRHTMIKELQTNSVTGKMIHIDFQRVLLDQAVHVTVPIELQGEAYGVKTEGGLLDFITRDIEVECLPTKIPAHLTLDVTDLHVGQTVEAGDLELPEGVSLREDANRTIVSLSHGRKAEEEEEGEGDGLLEQVAQEPEVIGKGSAETEDE